MEIDIAELEDVEIDDALSVPLKRMPHNSSGPLFVVLAREEGTMSRGSMPTIMKFLVKEVDVATGEIEEVGYDDEYALEDLEVGLFVHANCDEMSSMDLLHVVLKRCL